MGYFYGEIRIVERKKYTNERGEQEEIEEREIDIRDADTFILKEILKKKQIEKLLLEVRKRLQEKKKIKQKLLTKLTQVAKALENSSPPG